MTTEKSAVVDVDGTFHDQLYGKKSRQIKSGQHRPAERVQSSRWLTLTFLGRLQPALFITPFQSNDRLNLNINELAQFPIKLILTPIMNLKHGLGL